MKGKGVRSSRAVWLAPCASSLLLVAVLLLLQGACAGRAAGQEIASKPSGDALVQAAVGASRIAAPRSFSWPVAFTGKDHVDLKWDLLDPVYVTYKVIRDGDKLHPVASFGRDKTFYRDSGVAEGDSHTWMMCAYTAGGSEWCGHEEARTVGRIAGRVYQDLAWYSGDYGLVGTVYITGSVSLVVGSGATVVATSQFGSTQIDDDGKGAVQISGATIRTPVYLRSSGSFIASATVGPNGSVYLDGWDGSVVAGNTFTASGLSILGQSATRIEVSDNTFHDSWLACSGEREVHVSQNRFLAGAGITFQGQAAGAVDGNVFENSVASTAIDLHTSEAVNVRSNRLHKASVDVWPGSPATIERNLVEGPGAGAGIWVAGPQGVDIRSNAIRDWEYGIDLGSTGAARIEGNTIAGNRYGIYVDGDPTLEIHGNCIAGNPAAGSGYGTGLTTYSRTLPLDATGNYWGHATGPTHANNPSGQGDRIDEWDGNWSPAPGLVNYSGWLTSTNCAFDDLSIAGLEVVQVVQDLRNSVPLVSGKPAVLRVYPRALAAAITGVTAQVTAQRDGQTLQPPVPLVRSVTARPIVDWDAVRADRSGGLLYRLPDDWLTSTVTVTIEISPSQPLTELSLANNVLSRTLTFNEMSPLRVGYVPITYTSSPSAAAQAPSVFPIRLIHEVVGRMYPVPTASLQFLPPLQWPPRTGGSSAQRELGLRLLMALTHSWHGWNAAHHDRPVHLVVGMLPSGSITMCRSLDVPFQGIGRSAYCDPAPPVLHEMGHLFGLRHPCTRARANDCKGAWSPNPDWPVRYPNATIQEYGFDPVGDFVVPSSRFDVMTYWRRMWISPFHYEKALGSLGNLPRHAPEGSRVSADQTYLVASGLVYTDSTVSFLPFWQLMTDNPPGNPPAGTEYCLELRDAGDAVIESHCFDLGFYDEVLGADSHVDAFVVTLPLGAGAAKAALRQGPADIGQVSASDHPPTVTVHAPNGGESVGDFVPVSWTGDDDDGDPLAYSLSYSPDDGASWIPAAVNITGTTAYTLDLSLIPGGSACRVQVGVSDGFHTASDQSDASFSVTDKAPYAGILHPEDRSTVVPPLNLSGYGYDPDDGELQEEALVWASDRDGPLGTGSPLWGVDLSPGQHHLMLTATDSIGLQGSATITVDVESVYLPLVLRVW